MLEVGPTSNVASFARRPCAQPSERVEPYRRNIFAEALDTVEHRRPRYNLLPTGQVKNNWKSAGLMLVGVFCLAAYDAPGAQSVLPPGERRGSGRRRPRGGEG